MFPASRRGPVLTLDGRTSRVWGLQPVSRMHLSRRESSVARALPHRSSPMSRSLVDERSRIVLRASTAAIVLVFVVYVFVPPQVSNARNDDGATQSGKCTSPPSGGVEKWRME